MQMETPQIEYPPPAPLAVHGRSVRLLKVPRFAAQQWHAAGEGAVVAALVAEAGCASKRSPGSTSASSPDSGSAAGAKSAPLMSIILSHRIGGVGGAAAARIRNLRVRESTGDYTHICSYRAPESGDAGSFLVSSFFSKAKRARTGGAVAHPESLEPTPLAVEADVESVLTAVPGALSADYRSVLRSRTEAVRDQARPVQVAAVEETAEDSNAPRLFRYYHEPDQGG